MEHLLIANTRFIRSVTPSGVKRLLRNTMALQQSIKMLATDESTTEFERAKRYYELFFLTPTVRPSSIPRVRPTLTSIAGNA